MLDRSAGESMDKCIGKPVRRVEDFRLLTGAGEFTDDLNLERQAHAALVRAPHAHARVLGIDTAPALRMPGVVAVLTAADYVADGMRPMFAQGNPKDVELRNRDGSPIYYPPLEPLVTARVRRLGEALAMVVAESGDAARDAAEAVVVEYAPLPAETDPLRALGPDAPQLWAQASGNVCVHDHKGDTARVDAAFAAAAHVTRMSFVNNRVNGVPMEPRAAIGDHDRGSGRSLLIAGSQGVHRFQRELAHAFGEPPGNFRVVSRDTGGGYGTRNHLYPEFVLVVWAARRLRRPVKWTATRSESFLGDYYGRDLVTRAELALDAAGRFLALRTEHVANLGTHAVSFVPIARGPTVMNGLYHIPQLETTMRAVYTNSTPVTAYRGAGRPEAIFVIERLADAAAAQMGIDRVELRRRNLIASERLPYTNALGVTYDSGEFPRGMERALTLADWAGATLRREAARARGRLLGIGLANYVETSTGWPVERAEMRVLAGERVEVVIGTQSSGQGHETSFAQMIASLLGVPFECVTLRVGDTDVVAKGSGSHSARSMRVGGHLFVQTAEQVIEQGREVAARMFECAPQDVEFELDPGARPGVARRGGRYRVSGTDRVRTLLEVAAFACAPDSALPEALAGPLSGLAEIAVPMPAYPNGTHVAEVEVAPETGVVTLVRYTAVDDAGRIINPLLLEGQVHGGIVQGTGQATHERCMYDANGQLLTGSFMDYAMPRADEVPYFTVGHNEVPTATNRLGAKGGGEGGTTPAPAAIVNAVVDALREHGVRDLQMPLTAERVWRALHAR
jgi:carbon-monoxide dehydrogenase large subunit